MTDGTCRLCGSNNLTMFLDLGKMPHAGAFIKEDRIKDEVSYPLQVHFCNNCTLVQVLTAIPKETLFLDYHYLSSVTRTLTEHFREYAMEIVERFGLTKDSLVVEIGSNDGVLLKPLQDLRVKAVGVEPSVNVSKIAIDRGLNVINDFFTEDVAERIGSHYGKADVITANNVYAHIEDMDGTTRAIKNLLNEDGVFVFEVHYIVDLLERMQYDMIYHEHLCYYSIRALARFFEKFGMEIFDIKKVPIHGGSIRVYVKNSSSKKNPVLRSVNDFLQLENSRGIANIETYVKFADRVKSETEKLVTFLRGLKKDGKRVVGYGASGRANTILNYSGIGRDVLDYIVDESPTRYDHLTPGTHIPIVPPAKFRSDNPDYVLLLAWSYEKEILSKEKAFVDKGGKFIAPIPEVKIL